MMTEEQIMYGNELIAKFMGYEQEDGYYLMGEALSQFRGTDHGEWCSTKEIKYNFDHPIDIERYKETGAYYWMISPDHLCYESSWDWIMPVWFKILGMTKPDELEFEEIRISGRSVFMRAFLWTDSVWERKTIYYDFDYTDTKTVQEALFRTIVQFIEWYNINKTK